ncbi:MULTISPECIES: TetR/AcrR family transcriptional regulator [Niastella]|uniref:TetR/AcrR family transcriptional regulator n=1 Tax=Niastella soli TaxID=2821487 RepID=A0ABS3YQ29_9BACT|nr:TetR family transcriptional regulator [Niastella soli]MBO9199944.1 TetR/AcrR family transcriptional regulator [Niastella soli]
MSLTEKVDKRAHILSVAEQLFAENGFDGTSVRDIAQLANVNLAMISYYFGSKEKLLEALVEDRAGYTLGVIEELNKNQTLTPWDKIDKLVEFYIEKIMNNYRFHCILSQTYNQAKSSPIKELIISIKMRNLEEIKKVIADGQRKKLFAKVDVELTMASVFGTLTQVVNSANLYSRLMKIDETDDATYRKKMSARLKTHLQQMLRAHLDIKNEE